MIKNNDRQNLDQNGDDIMSPADLGRKLVIALRSVSDPQALMQAIADRTAITLRNEFLSKIESMEQATSLWHDDLVRVPTDVQKTTDALKDYITQFILRTAAELNGSLGTSVEKSRGEINTLRDVSEERFNSIQTQFSLLKQATEQLDIANKTAIAAALQAQKEQAGETQKTSQAAIAKSEASMSEALKSLTTAVNTAIGGVTDRLNDLKSRMDRGEGKTSISDPELTAKLAQITAQLSLLASSDSHGGGRREAQKDYTTTMIAIGAIVIAAVALLAPHLGIVH